GGLTSIQSPAKPAFTGLGIDDLNDALARYRAQVMTHLGFFVFGSQERRTRACLRGRRPTSVGDPQDEGCTEHSVTVWAHLTRVPIARGTAGLAARHHRPGTGRALPFLSAACGAGSVTRCFMARL